MMLFQKAVQAEGLTRWPLLEEIGGRRRRRVERNLEPMLAIAGTELAVQDRRGRDCFLLASGHVTIERDGEAITELGPGDFFGEIALLTGGPRTATVVAADDVVVERMNRRQFAAVLDAWPELARLVMSEARVRLRAA